MGNDEVNWYIHTEIMGKCWHEFPLIPDRDTEPHCLHCKQHAFYLDTNYVIGGDTVAGKFNPDYCSDSSPRSLLNEVVAKVGASRTAWLLDSKVPSRGTTALLASAEQIARACYHAHKNSDASTTPS